jgi:hypothetical protein
MTLKSEQVRPKAVQSRRFMDRAEHFEVARNTEPAAGEILFFAPAPVRTGVDLVVFKSLPPVAVPLRCRACGQVHRWKPQDAWINTNS